jgi:hypothetical protein
LFCAVDVSISVSRKTEKCSVSSSSEFPEAWIYTPHQPSIIGIFMDGEVQLWTVWQFSPLLYGERVFVVAELFPFMNSCV